MGSSPPAALARSKNARISAFLQTPQVGGACVLASCSASGRHLCDEFQHLAQQLPSTLERAFILILEGHPGSADDAGHGPCSRSPMGGPPTSREGQGAKPRSLGSVRDVSSRLLAALLEHFASIEL